MTNYLVWVSDFNFVSEFNIAGDDTCVTIFFGLFATFDFKSKLDWSVGVALKTNVFKVEHDVDDIFTNTFDCSEFVSSTFDTEGSNCSTLNT